MSHMHLSVVLLENNYVRRVPLEVEDIPRLLNSIVPILPQLNINPYPIFCMEPQTAICKV